MKTTVNHTEILMNLRAEYDNIMKVREEARNAWKEAKKSNEPWIVEYALWEEYHKTDEQKEHLEREIKFHSTMLQDKVHSWCMRYYSEHDL